MTSTSGSDECENITSLHNEEVSTKTKKLSEIDSEKCEAGEIWTEFGNFKLASKEWKNVKLYEKGKHKFLEGDWKKF